VPCRQFSEAGHIAFIFYSHERNEPPHIHADRNEKSTKFWLNPVAFAANFGFSSSELAKVQSIVETNRVLFLEEWNGYFGAQGG